MQITLKASLPPEFPEIDLKEPDNFEGEQTIQEVIQEAQNNFHPYYLLTAAQTKDGFEFFDGVVFSFYAKQCIENNSKLETPVKNALVEKIYHFVLPLFNFDASKICTAVDLKESKNFKFYLVETSKSTELANELLLNALNPFNKTISQHQFVVGTHIETMIDFPEVKEDLKNTTNVKEQSIYALQSMISQLVVDQNQSQKEEKSSIDVTSQELLKWFWCSSKINPNHDTLVKLSQRCLKIPELKSRGLEYLQQVQSSKEKLSPSTVFMIDKLAKEYLPK